MKRHTILLAGELGAGLGHVIPLYRLSEALHETAEAQGVDITCVFAVHNPGLLHEMKRAGDLAIQAPKAAVQEKLKAHTGSYAEVLIANGFAHAAELERNAASWEDIFTLTGASLLAADHSPTAVLAARGRMPTLVIGNGFTAPPARIETYPAMVAGRSAPAVQSLLKGNVNQVLAKRGVAPVSHLPAFMEGDQRAVFSLRELDPYGALRDTPLAGLYEQGVRPTPLPKEPRVFLYGHAEVASFPALAQMALDTGLPVSAYLTGNNEEMAFLLRQRGAEILTRLPDLATALPRMSVVVSNGGAGLSQAALVAGRPHVVCPIHAESQMTARALERLGCAIVTEKPDARDAKNAIAEAAADETLHMRCQETATALFARNPNMPLDAIAATFLARLPRNGDKSQIS